MLTCTFVRLIELYPSPVPGARFINLGSLGAMASSSRAMAALAQVGRLAPQGRTASRAFSTTSRTTALRSARITSMITKLQTPGRIAFRRAYADAAPLPKPKPGKLRRTFRWMWRLTYLSLGGLAGYTFYIIYQDRNPEPQYAPDPSKKTLVILGERNRS